MKFAEWLNFVFGTDVDPTDLDDASYEELRRIWKEVQNV